MTTYLYRLMIFVRSADATASMKKAFANMFADFGSGESRADQQAMYNSVTKFVRSSDPDGPVVAFGVSTAAKGSLKDELRTFLQQFPQARIVITASVAHDQFAEDELIWTNFNVTPNGQLIDWAEALRLLKEEFDIEPQPQPQEA